MNSKPTFVLLFFVIISVNVFGVAPVVVEAIPDNNQINVDPALKRIKIVFDQDMITGQTFSICGGGEMFPEMTGKPKWLGKRTLVLGVKLLPGKEYQLSINCQSFKNCKNISGESAVPYPISFKTGSGAGASFEPSNEFEEKIAKINLGNCSPKEAIEVFGKPEGKEMCSKDKSDQSYVLKYPEGMNVFVNDKTVKELRFKKPSKFSYNGIKIGSSLIEVIKILGRPGKQLNGKSNDHQDNVLYRNINGQKGFCYYARGDQGVRCFFTKNKVSAIYLTASREATEVDIYIVSFRGIGGFNPKTKKELLNAFNNRHADGAKTSYFRTKTEDGKMTGRICVNTKKDAQSLIRRLKQNRKLELISSTSEPISKEEFEKHKATR